LIRFFVLAAAGLMAALPCFGIAVWNGWVRAPRWLPMRSLVERVIEAAAAFRSHKTALATAVGLSFAGHVILACMFAAAGKVVMPEAPVFLVCMLSLLGMFANALPVTPGGLGVGESAFQGLFALAGYSAGAPLMLSWRIGMGIQCLIGCLLYIRGVRHPEAEIQEA
jgi:uncharacterized membrane protein YbhN (UPF0104 family)